MSSCIKYAATNVQEHIVSLLLRSLEVGGALESSNVGGSLSYGQEGGGGETQQPDSYWIAWLVPSKNS